MAAARHLIKYVLIRILGFRFTFGYADSRTVFVAFERKTGITSITDTDLINAGLKFGVNVWYIL